MAKRFLLSPVTKEGAKTPTTAKKAPTPAKPYQRPSVGGTGAETVPAAKKPVTSVQKPPAVKKPVTPVKKAPTPPPKPPAARQPPLGKAKPAAPAQKAPVPPRPPFAGPPAGGPPAGRPGAGAPGAGMPGAPPQVVAEMKAAQERALEAQKAKPKTYVVKSGDSLSKIAKELLGDAARWPEIFELNKDKIQDPNLIRVGQELVLP